MKLIYLTAAILLLSTAAGYAQKTPQAAVSVIVSPVKLQPFADRVEALGTTKANETVTVTANTTEKITGIHFEDGQEVKRGDLLVTLDKSEEDAELRSAEAQLSEAQSAYDRAKNLQDSSALSRGTLQERLATLQQNQAAIEAVKARIEKLTITAPFDGILGLREVSVGALIQPGDVITTIDDLHLIKVDFDVPSVFLQELKPGLKIAGKVEAFGDRVFSGEVQTVNTQVDPVTRTVTVRAVLPNSDTTLKPGLLMSITLLKDQREALLIPEESIIKRGDRNFVYVATRQGEKTIAKQQEIKIGSRQPGIIEVLSGLKAAEQIVSHGTLKVSDGMEITIRATENEDAPLEDLLKQNTQGQPQQDKEG